MTMTGGGPPLYSSSLHGKYKKGAEEGEKEKNVKGKMEGRSTVSLQSVMFSGKQTTAHKMADQLKNCINQRAHGFYSNRIHTAGSV